jgi:hypothetical protein
MRLLARFMNNSARQMSFYAANAIFRYCARLTGFPSARNIVRIRTKDPAAESRGMAPPNEQACS